MDSEKGNHSAARARLEERAFGPDATPDDLHALAEFDRAADHRRLVHLQVAAISAAVAASGRTPWRRTSVLLVGTSAALLCGVLGVIIGFASHGGESDQGPAEAGPAQLGSVQSILQPFVAADFDVPQTRIDLPQGAIPSNLVRSTFRSIGVADNNASDDLRVFVAKDTHGADCLVATHSGELSSVCVSGKFFPASGLTLSWYEDGVSNILSWLPDGTLKLANWSS